MERYYIWLIQLMQPGNPVIHDILNKYGTAENAYNAIIGGDFSLLNEKQKNDISYITIDKADKVIEYCRKAEISLVKLGDKEYPKLLAEIYNPPALLFYRGNLSCLNKLCITIVGAREATPYIMKLCSKVCRDLCKAGIVLVSGMAKGIDRCANSLSATDNFPTVGVLACGIDIDYPYDTLALREYIAMSGGVYMTEFLPGTQPGRDNFKIRNRIMAGLSRGTAVFQASAESGSLITAAYAADENRDVFCVPPPDIFSDIYAGVISLLRDGAIPLFNHEDIIKQYIGIYL